MKVVMMAALAMTLCAVSAAAADDPPKATGKAHFFDSWKVDCMVHFSVLVEEDLVLKHPAKGHFNYTDETGNFYGVTIDCVKMDIEHGAVWFSGEIFGSTDGTLDGRWLFAKAYDCGRRGPYGDQITCSILETDPHAMVDAMVDPPDPPCNVSHGDVSVGPIEQEDPPVEDDQPERVKRQTRAQWEKSGSDDTRVVTWGLVKSLY